MIPNRTHSLSSKGLLKLLILHLVIFIVLVSCKQPSTFQSSEIAARVGNQVLLKKDIPDIVLSGISQPDSEKVVKKYITSWVKNILLMKKAEKNLSAQQIQDVNKQLEETKSALLIYKYEQEMIRQRLDTIVSDNEIQSYYDRHQNNFILKKNIVKALYIKVPRSAPNIDNVRKWYRSDDNSAMTSLESYSYQFANKFDDFNEKWVCFDLVLSKIPLIIRNQERFLRRNKFIEESDSSYFYFVDIRDYKLRFTVSPSEFVRYQISSVIQNQRKILFIKSMENNLYNDALNRSEFVIY